MGEVHAVGLQAAARQALRRQPEVPQRHFIIIRRAGDGGVEALITFNVISLGRQDGHHSLRQAEFNDFAQVGLEGGAGVDVVGAEHDEHQHRAVDAELAGEGRLARFARLGSAHSGLRAEAAVKPRFEAMLTRLNEPAKWSMVGCRVV